MIKVWGSEARFRLSSLALDIIGARAVLRAENGESAPLTGKFEEDYFVSPRWRFTGGTNDVQRRIIATRGLGLPRG